MIPGFGHEVVIKFTQTYLHIWLVVSTILKNMKVSWDDDILNWMEK